MSEDNDSIFTMYFQTDYKKYKEKKLIQHSERWYKW